MYSLTYKMYTMLISNSLSSSVKTNTKLSRSRSNIYKNKAQFFKHPNSHEVELELVSEEVQVKLNKQIKREQRVRLIANVITITLMVVAMTGVLIWLL